MSRRGSILVFSLIGITVLLVLGAGLMALSRSLIDIQSRDRARLQAKTAAEAGLDDAIKYMETHFGVTDVSSLQGIRLGETSFDVNEIIPLGGNKFVVSATGYAAPTAGGGRAQRTLETTVHLLPAGFRYAILSDGTISAGGSSQVSGRMHGNGDIATTVSLGGSFDYIPLIRKDFISAVGGIVNGSDPPVPPQNLRPNYTNVELPTFNYTAFYDTTLFPTPEHTIYKVVPATETRPDGTIIKNPDGTYTYYWGFTGKGKWMGFKPDDINLMFPPRDAGGGIIADPNAKVIINWQAGKDTNGDGIVDTDNLLINGNGTITSTLVVYNPGLPNGGNGAITVNGCVQFEPRLGIALAAYDVDLSKVNGTANIGTDAYPALIYATGSAEMSGIGDFGVRGSLVVGGSLMLSPNVSVSGNSHYYWDPGFIDRLPVDWQVMFPGDPDIWARRLSWQER